MDAIPVPAKRWARVEYERLVDRAFFQPGDRVDHVLEVHHDPTPSADAPYGWRFSTQRRLGATATVSPLRAPRARIPIADLLP